MKFIHTYIYLILTGLLINSNEIESAITPPTPLTDNVPHTTSTDPQLHGLVNTYKTQLFPQYSNPTNLLTTYNDAFAISLFESFFFIPRSANALPSNADSTQFLTSLKTAYLNIYNFVYHQPNLVFQTSLEKIFQNTLNSMTDRYGLAKIEDMSLNNNGFLGTNVRLNIPAGSTPDPNIFRRTINSLTGRIFVVKNSPAGPSILTYASGIILPRVNGMRVVYDQIITCCHSMVSFDSSPDLEFYFVRSQHLNPDTGLPDPATIGLTIPTIVLTPGQTYDQVVDTQHFITYLRQKSASTNTADNYVRRITNFKAFHGKVSELKSHIPRYTPETDCGYGYLNNSFNFPLRAKFARINILKNIPSQANNYDYYSVGYACFNYYDTSTSSLLCQEQFISPFTMTKSKSGTLALPGHLPTPAVSLILGISSNFIRHAATTMKGMSGGPLLIFDSANQQINILGVVSSGYLDESYACKFW